MVYLWCRVLRYVPRYFEYLNTWVPKYLLTLNIYRETRGVWGKGMRDRGGFPGGVHIEEGGGVRGKGIKKDKKTDEYLKETKTSGEQT